MIDRVGPWKCFHCDEVFNDFKEAGDHFGYGEISTPACKIDAAHLRELEIELFKYRLEDTELHREIHRLVAKNQQDCRRAEELGYARGLRDAHLINCTCPTVDGVRLPGNHCQVHNLQDAER